MTKDTLHVIPNDGSWAVKREGNERASSTHKTQREAIDAARDLATEGDELVIHRPDGAIRGHTTYTPTAASQNLQTNSSTVSTLPSDVMSVGTRVSWGAVLAGVVVALAVYFTLNLLTFAIGISTIDQMGINTFTVTAAVVSTLSLLLALFLGGYVASTSTVGEGKCEAMTYGTLVWATMLLLLVVMGFGLGLGFFAGVRGMSNSSDPVMITEDLKQQLNLTDEQVARYATFSQSGQSIDRKVSAAGLAWWSFGGLVLSLLAAVGGSLAGAGPAMVLKHIRSRRVAVLDRNG